MDFITGIVEKPQKVVVYGPEGIGKSSFAAKFPDPVFIDTEGSTRRLDVTRTPSPSSWAMLVEQIKYFKTHPHPFKTVVIDTADWAEQLCMTDVCARAQKSGIEDFGYGKGYVYVAEDFGRLLNLLEELIDKGLHVVVTAHAKMRKFEQPDEMGSYDRWEMKLSKNTAPMLREWADIVLFANYETHVIKPDNKMEKSKVQGGKRVMYTSHHPCWDAKNRHGLATKLSFEYEQIGEHIKDFSEPNSAPPQTLETEQSAPTQPPLDLTAKADDQTLTAPEEKPAPTTTPRMDSTSPPPASETKPQTPSPPGEDMWSGVPGKLKALMQNSGVLPFDIQRVVGQRGYFPEKTPIKNYPPDFVDGCLISLWPQVLAMVEKNNGPLPF